MGNTGEEKKWYTEKDIEEIKQTAYDEGYDKCWAYLDRERVQVHLKVLYSLLGFSVSGLLFLAYVLGKYLV